MRLVVQISARKRGPVGVLDEVSALVEASIVDNTRRAYRSDLAHFALWGSHLPAEPALVASYLAAHATGRRDVSRPAHRTRR